MRINYGTTVETLLAHAVCNNLYSHNSEDGKAELTGMHG